MLSFTDVMSFALIHYFDVGFITNLKVYTINVLKHWVAPVLTCKCMPLLSCSLLCRVVQWPDAYKYQYVFVSHAVVRILSLCLDKVCLCVCTKVLNVYCWGYLSNECVWVWIMSIRAGLFVNQQASDLCVWEWLSNVSSLNCIYYSLLFVNMPVCLCVMFQL